MRYGIIPSYGRQCIKQTLITPDPYARRSKPSSCALLGCLLVWRRASEGLVEAKASGIKCTKYGEDKCVIGSMSPNTLSTKFLLDPIRLDLNGRGH
jgi:hypothetical protein